MRRSSVFRLTAPLLGVCLVAACAAGTGPDGSAGADDVPSDSAQPASRPPFATSPPLGSGSAVEIPDGLSDEVWTAVLDALAASSGETVDASAVELVSAEAVTWNDGSLGCPEPGQAYTQALVDGFQVVVEFAGDEYDFRVPTNGEPRLCEASLPRGG